MLMKHWEHSFKHKWVAQWSHVGFSALLAASLHAYSMASLLCLRQIGEHADLAKPVV